MVMAVGGQAMGSIHRLYVRLQRSYSSITANLFTRKRSSALVLPATRLELLASREQRVR